MHGEIWDSSQFYVRVLKTKTNYFTRLIKIRQIGFGNFCELAHASGRQKM